MDLNGSIKYLDYSQEWIRMVVLSCQVQSRMDLNGSIKHVDYSQEWI